LKTTCSKLRLKFKYGWWRHPPYPQYFFSGFRRFTKMIFVRSGRTVPPLVSPVAPPLSVKKNCYLFSTGSAWFSCFWSKFKFSCFLNRVCICFYLYLLVVWDPFVPDPFVRDPIVRDPFVLGLICPGTHLFGTHLSGTHLSGTRLSGTHLSWDLFVLGSICPGTHLFRTRLSVTHLSGFVWDPFARGPTCLGPICPRIVIPSGSAPIPFEKLTWGSDLIRSDKITKL